MAKKGKVTFDNKQSDFYDHYHHASDVVPLVTVYGDLNAAILRAQTLMEFNRTNSYYRNKNLGIES